jgi:hypothetical protein
MLENYIILKEFGDNIKSLTIQKNLLKQLNLNPELIKELNNELYEFKSNFYSLMDTIGVFEYSFPKFEYDLKNDVISNDIIENVINFIKSQYPILESIKIQRENWYKDFLENVKTNKLIKIFFNKKEYYFKISQQEGENFKLIQFNLMRKQILNPILEITSNSIKLKYGNEYEIPKIRLLDSPPEKIVILDVKFNNINFVDKNEILNVLTQIDNEIFNGDVLKENITLHGDMFDYLGDVRYSREDVKKLKEKLSNGIYFKELLDNGEIGFIFKYNVENEIFDVYSCDYDYLNLLHHNLDVIIRLDQKKEYGIQISKDEFDSILNNMYQRNLNFLKGLLE